MKRARSTAPSWSSLVCCVRRHSSTASAGPGYGVAAVLVAVGITKLMSRWRAAGTMSAS